MTDHGVNEQSIVRPAEGRYTERLASACAKTQPHLPHRVLQVYESPQANVSTVKCIQQPQLDIPVNKASPPAMPASRVA